MPIEFVGLQGQPLPEVPGFTIEETEGQERRIRLRGRAMPGQDVAWETKQRTKFTWYPGNPVGTVQLLGPEHGETRVSGTWKARFLPGQVEFDGFEGTLQTPEELVNAFRSIQLSGALLRVQWGPETRFGIMTDFTAAWVRVQDCRWDCTFNWIGFDESSPRAQGASAGLTTSAVRDSLSALDDEFVLDPPTVLAGPRDEIDALLRTSRNGVGMLFDAVRDVQSQLVFPLTAVRAAVSAIEQVKTATSDVIDRLSDTPYTVRTVFDSVVDVLDVESWGRSVALAARQQRAVVQKQGLELQKKASPGAVEVVVVPGDTTLRQLAQKYYGDADSWQLIADVNDIVGSVVAAGTVVIITPKPTALP